MESNHSNPLNAILKELGLKRQDRQNISNNNENYPQKVNPRATYIKDGYILDEQEYKEQKVQKAKEELLKVQRNIVEQQKKKTELMNQINTMREQKQQEQQLAQKMNNIVEENKEICYQGANEFGLDLEQEIEVKDQTKKISFEQRKRENPNMELIDLVQKHFQENNE